MKKILALVLVTCLLLALNVSAFAADKTYELKLSTTQTDTSMIYAGMKAASLSPSTPPASSALRRT